MALPFEMPDEQASAAMQLIQEAAASAKAAEAASAEARHEVDLLKGEMRRFGSLAEKHESILDGNGGEGLKERLSHAKRTADGNRDRMAKIEEKIDARAGYRWEFWKVVLAAAISAAGGALAALIAAGGGG